MSAAIVAARVVPYRLPLVRTWVAASATLVERQGALLCVTTAEGLSGWGDCAPLPSSGVAGQERVLAALAAYAGCLVRAGSGYPDAELPPEVRWAVETARLDIEAQRKGVPLARLITPSAPLRIAVNAALGPLDAECAARAAEALAQGYGIGKIKVGLAAVDCELERLRGVVAATAGRLRLRLDANCAWRDEEARRFLAGIADLPIEAVEEPLAEPTSAALAALQAGRPYAIAVDESLTRLGLEDLIRAEAVRRLVIKPARIGGIGATQAVARQATAAGIEVVLTSVVDSAVGVVAAAHLAAAVAPGTAHGLGTGPWLARDVAAGPPVVQGWMTLPETPGLGIRPM